ncbi:MAG: hypothetical protein K6E81_06330 [Lachnospiraceae bacterium]|nr:hypothetical protein [Lachnospiraceae bacterium]
MKKPEPYEKSLLALERIAEENGGKKSRLLTDPVCLYLGQKRAGVLDVAQLEDMDAQDFFVSVYLSIFEELPKDDLVEKWRPKMQELSVEDFRREVLESFLALPDVRSRRVFVENNFYLSQDAVTGPKGIKARVLSAGYGIARKLPLSWKIRLKKLAMRFLVK